MTNTEPIPQDEDNAAEVLRAQRAALVVDFLREQGVMPQPETDGEAPDIQVTLAHRALDSYVDAVHDRQPPYHAKYLTRVMNDIYFTRHEWLGGKTHEELDEASADRKRSVRSNYDRWAIRTVFSPYVKLIQEKTGNDNGKQPNEDKSERNSQFEQHQPYKWEERHTKNLRNTILDINEKREGLRLQENDIVGLLLLTGLEKPKTDDLMVIANIEKIIDDVVKQLRRKISQQYDEAGNLLLQRPTKIQQEGLRCLQILVSDRSDVRRTIDQMIDDEPLSVKQRSTMHEDEQRAERKKRVHSKLAHGLELVHFH